MFCEKCGAPIEDGEKFCANCGAPVSVPAEPAVSEAAAEATVMLSAEPETPAAESASAESVASATPETPAAEPVASAAPETPAAESAPVEPVASVAPETPVAASAPVEPTVSATPSKSSFISTLKADEYQTGMNASTGSGKKEKKSKKKADAPSGDESGKKSALPLIVGIIAAVALVIAVVCVVFGASVGNFFHKTFSSDAKYYQYVEKRNLAEVVKLSGSYYDRLIDNMNFTDRGLSIELEAAVDKGGRELLDNLADSVGMDFDWLKSVKLGANVSVKDSMFSVGADAALNKEGVVSGQLLLDIDKGTIYMQIPELTEKYIGIDLEDTMSSYEWESFEAIQDFQKQSKKLVAALPKTAEVQKLINKYLNLAFGSIDKVSKSTDTLKVGGVKQKCTVLKVKINAKTLEKMITSVAKEMSKDKDLKKIIIDTVDAGGSVLEDAYGLDVDGKDVYDEFKDALDEILDSVDGISDRGGDFEIVMKVYVDGKGNTVGRTIEYGEGDDKVEINALMAEAGGKFGYEFSMSYPSSSYDWYSDRWNYETKTVSLTGKGSKSGNKLTGKFTLEAEGQEFEFKVTNLDKESLKQGNVNGSISFEIPGNYYMSDIALTLDSKMTDKSIEWSVAVEYDGAKIGTITAKGQLGSGSKASAPASKNVVTVEDEDDLEDWFETIKWKDVIKKLEKAGLPDEILDRIEDLADEIEDYGLDGLYHYNGNATDTAPSYGYPDW